MSRVCVTGGTGTLGRALIAHFIAAGDTVCSVSRDEVKAGELQAAYPDHPNLRIFLGTVRDRDRLIQAFQGCDAVIHAAALKRVEQGSYSPEELIKTNIQGTINAIHAAAEAGVKKFILVSSDKAVHATNLYGSTKFTAECYAVGANSYTYPRGLSVSVVRYGNVLGSRGSVVHIWNAIPAPSPLCLTHPSMTRFIITQAQAVHVITHALAMMQGGEIFIPRLPAMRMVDLLEALHPGRTVWTSGLRPGGEKLHETLVSDEELDRLYQNSLGSLMVLPHFRSWTDEPYEDVTPVQIPHYTSEFTEKLGINELRSLCAGL